MTVMTQRTSLEVRHLSSEGVHEEVEAVEEDMPHLSLTAIDISNNVAM